MGKLRNLLVDPELLAVSHKKVNFLEAEDKEEMQKKKMAIMLKKLGGSKEDKNMDGEARLAQINQ